METSRERESTQGNTRDEHQQRPRHDHSTRGARARRAATLSVAGVIAGLALAPTSAFADHPTSEGGGTATLSGDKWSYMYDVAQRKEAMARDPGRERRPDHVRHQ